MAAQIPPWLDVSPNSFLAATESGDRAGESQRATDIGVDQFQQQEQQRAISQAAAIAQENQRLQQIQKAAAVNAQVTQQKNQNDFLIKMQQDNVLSAYRQSQLGFQKDQLAQQAAEAASKFQQSATKEGDIRSDAQAKLKAQADAKADAKAAIEQNLQRKNQAESYKIQAGAKLTLAGQLRGQALGEQDAAKKQKLNDDAQKLADEAVSLNQQAAQALVSTDAALPLAGNPPPPPGTPTQGGAITATNPPKAGIQAHSLPSQPKPLTVDEIKTILAGANNSNPNNNKLAPPPPNVSPLEHPDGVGVPDMFPHPGQPGQLQFMRKPAAESQKPSSSDISYLVAHPELKAKFDAKFGAGASDDILQSM